MFRAALVLIIFGALAGTGWAQSTLTVEEAVVQALAANPRVRAVSAAGREARARADQARAGYFPRLDFSEAWQRGEHPVFVAEIGDIGRFSNPAKLASWAGLTPRHRESDATVRRGHITKQGSKLVRWAAGESVQRATTTKIAADKAGIESRRGRNIATVAAARKQLTHVFYGLRDGHIRALDRDKAAA